MSIASYRRNVRLGVTGRDTETCCPAALEQVSPRHGFEPEIYTKYLEFVNWYDALEGQDRRQRNPAYKRMISEMAWQLGEVEYDDIEFYRAETYREFSNIVRTLMRHEYRVVVDTIAEGFEDDCHAIGLQPLDESLYRARSTWVPPQLHGAITLRAVFGEIYMHKDPPRLRYTFNDANITALPPAS